MSDFSNSRKSMVDCQIRPSDVTKFPIIEAMLAVPREVYVPSDMRDVAYAGTHLPLGGARVVADPRVLAKTLDALDIGKSDLVLEIGCGLGYSTAVVAHIAEAVIAVESDPELAAEAEANLSSQSVDNAVVITGMLENGSAKHGPYDVILFGGAVEIVPPAIIAQLKDGGRIAAVFMSQGAGKCRLGVKVGDKMAWRDVFDASESVLPGFRQEAEFAL